MRPVACHYTKDAIKILFEHRELKASWGQMGFKLSAPFQVSPMPTHHVRCLHVLPPDQALVRAFRHGCDDVAQLARIVQVHTVTGRFLGRTELSIYTSGLENHKTCIVRAQPFVEATISCWRTLHGAGMQTL